MNKSNQNENQFQTPECLFGSDEHEILRQNKAPLFHKAMDLNFSNPNNAINILNQFKFKNYISIFPGNFYSWLSLDHSVIFKCLPFPHINPNSLFNLTEELNFVAQTLHHHVIKRLISNAQQTFTNHIVVPFLRHAVSNLNSISDNVYVSERPIQISKANQNSNFEPIFNLEFDSHFQTNSDSDFHFDYLIPDGKRIDVSNLTYPEAVTILSNPTHPNYSSTIRLIKALISTQTFLHVNAQTAMRHLFAANLLKELTHSNLNTYSIILEPKSFGDVMMLLKNNELKKYPESPGSQDEIYTRMISTTSSCTKCHNHIQDKTICVFDLIKKNVRHIHCA